MLRPMDIVSLVRATNFDITLTQSQIHLHMKWWRQTFYDMRWAEKNPNITVIGKDLARLSYSIERWYFFDPSRLRLLVIVDQSLVTDEHDETTNAILRATDTCVWLQYQQKMHAPFACVQTCIVSLKRGIYVDLEEEWIRDLLEPVVARWPVTEHYYLTLQGTLAPLTPVSILPDGLRWSNDLAPIDPWFRAWYVNLRLPELFINMSITRPDICIDTAAPAIFDANYNMRLALTGEGSPIVPSVPYASFP